MPNVLPLHVRVRIVEALLEGVSIRATAERTQTKKDTVTKLGLKVGLGCAKLHDRLVTPVRARLIEVVEVEAGADAITLFGVDADTKLVPGYVTGKRSLTTATRLLTDLRRRVKGTPRLSVDEWPSWPEAVRRTFGWQYADAGVIVRGRSSIGELPHMSFRSAGRVKRSTLAAAVGLRFFWYNCCCIHEATGETPAVKAGIAERAWSVEELVRAALDEAGDPQPEPPRLYPSSYRRKRHTDVVAGVNV